MRKCKLGDCDDINNWGFKKSKNETLERVDLPHTNHIVPYNYFNEKDYQFISYYEKKIILKNPDKRYILSFEGIMTAFHLLVDGEDLGEYKGGYLPHRIELPGFHGDPKTIHLEVVVDSTEREEIPPFGNIVDYLAFGGIYRDVYLYELESTFLSDAAIRYEVSSIEGETGTVCVTPVVEIDSLKQGTPICLKLQLAGQEHLCEAVTLGGVQTIQFPTFACEEMLLWHTDAPHLYDCHIVLEEAG
ncbi:MAG: hypothetical protein RR590_10625, partial [Hungatella sp.]